MPGYSATTVDDREYQVVFPRWLHVPSHEEGALCSTAGSSVDFQVPDASASTRQRRHYDVCDAVWWTGSAQTYAPSDGGDAAECNQSFQQANHAREWLAGHPIGDHIARLLAGPSLATETLAHAGYDDALADPRRTAPVPYMKCEPCYTPYLSRLSYLYQASWLPNLVVSSMRLGAGDPSENPESITPEVDSARGTIVELRFRQAVRASADAVFEDGVDTAYGRLLRRLVNDFGQLAVGLLRDYVTDPTFPRELAAEAFIQMGQIDSPGTRDSRASLLIEGLAAAYPSVRDAAATALMNVASASEQQQIREAIEAEPVVQIRESLRELLDQVLAERSVQEVA